MGRVGTSSQEALPWGLGPRRTRPSQQLFFRLDWGA